MVTAGTGRHAALDQTEVTVGGSLESWELALLIAIVGATTVGLAWPLLKAWGRRLEGRPLQALLTARLEQLDDLSVQLKRVETRCAELEQRVEFAERLLERPEPRPTPVTRVVTPKPNDS